MVILSWLRFALGCDFLLVGMFLFGIQIIALFKFDYVLNRMQARQWEIPWESVVLCLV